jgi:hypothetical protein
LTKATIKNTEQDLIQKRNYFQQLLETDTFALNSLPDIHSIKKEADIIRQQLLERFSGKERLNEMSFDDKRALLHWLFDGQDKSGKPYGIYITKRGKRDKSKIDYFMYGKITGLRTLKGNDINYQKWDEDDKDSKEYMTNNIGLIL